jgi:hypothetical protein
VVERLRALGHQRNTSVFIKVDALSSQELRWDVLDGFRLGDQMKSSTRPIVSSYHAFMEVSS